MANNKNQNQNQGQGGQRQQDMGNKDRQQSGNFGGEGGDLNRDRDVQGNQGQGQKGGQGGMQKGSTNIEQEDVRSGVGNDNDLDRDLEDQNDIEEGEITQRNPRQGDQGQQGSQKVGRDQGQGQTDRDRNK